MLPEDVHHLQLPLLHNHVECVRIQVDAVRVLHVVVHEQAVGQSGPELKRDLPAQPQLERLDDVPVHLDERVVGGEHERLLVSRLLKGQLRAALFVGHGGDGADELPVVQRVVWLLLLERLLSPAGRLLGRGLSGQLVAARSALQVRGQSVWGATGEDEEAKRDYWCDLWGQFLQGSPTQ